MEKTNLSIKNSFIKVLTGSDLSSRRLAYMELKSKNPGPVVWLTAGVHGDEVGGIVIVQEVFKQLQRGGLLKGSVYAFPLMNPIGFEAAARSTVLSGEDLNRAFPGNKQGSFAERIADTIFQQIIKTKPTLVLDLHNDWSNSIPYTLIDPYPGLKHRQAYELVKNYSKETGFVIINE
ncbi:MAG: succinylglutamate desuccinylase/aspartoacylase family protein, partial [bacterium]